MKLISAIFVSLLFISPASALDESKLIGKIDVDRYQAVENLFSVQLPFDITARTREQIQIQERTNSTTTTVAFSHSLPNRPVYRMEITNVPASEVRLRKFINAAYDTLAYYQRAIEQALKSPLKMLDDAIISYQKKQTLKHLFKINTPQPDLVQYHVMYLSDFGEKIMLCWVNFTVSNPDKTVDAAVLDGSFAKMQKADKFCQSLRL